MQSEPRKGKIAASTEAGRSRNDILGPAVPLRAREEPSSPLAADLSNVIPFARKRKLADAREAPPVIVSSTTRPAPWLFTGGRDRIMLFVAGSIAVHLGLYGFFFDREPPPLASIGLQSITVEIVVGADTLAGLNKTPTQSEISSHAAPEEPKPQAVTPETARKQPEPAREADVKIAAAETAKLQTTPAETAKPMPAERAKLHEREPAPVEKAEPVRPEPATPELTKPKPMESERVQTLSVEPTLQLQQAELVADPKPVDAVQPPQLEKPIEVAAAEPVESPRPDRTDIAAVVTPADKPELRQPDRPTLAKIDPKPAEKPQELEPEKVAPVPETPKKPPQVKRARDDAKDRRNRAAPASTPSVASNSVGRGRSDATTNYRGLVAAHLARFKQFPADARSRGDQGTTVITFSIDGNGRVTSVRLTRGSGVASFDRESQAMTRRASPFPAPPTGRAMSFTVPISFALR